MPSGVPSGLKNQQALQHIARSLNVQVEIVFGTEALCQRNDSQRAPLAVDRARTDKNQGASGQCSYAELPQTPATRVFPSAIRLGRFNVVVYFTAGLPDATVSFFLIMILSFLNF
jgi:hypothetical protein